MRFTKFSLACYILLLFWFSLDLIGIPGLVTRDDWLGLPGLLELLLIAILAGYLLSWRYVVFPCGITLGVWAYLQYASHWQYFLFGASPEKLQRYYAFFKGTARFFPESYSRLIPDAYHTVLGLLLLINLVCVLVQIVTFFRNA